MSDILTDFGLLASQNQFLAYFIIYLATIFVGNISAFASFWLLYRGFLGSWGLPLLVLTIFVADVSGDLLWYSLGRLLRDTGLGNFVKNHLPQHDKIETHLQSNGRRWIFFSKLLYASSFPIIFSVGWAKIEFKRFFKTSLLSILTWLPILLGLAYGIIIGLLPLRTLTIFKRFEVIFLLGLILFFLADYFVARLFKRLFGKNLD